MAFGDLLQQDDSGYGSTQSCTLPGSPSSGNILVLASSNNSGSATISTPPSGFTELQVGTGTGVRGALYYKVSAGSETSTSIVWSTGNGTAHYFELDFDGQTLVTPVQTNEDETNSASAGATQSQNCGLVTPANATNIWVGAIAHDQANNGDASQVWADSATVIRALADVALSEPAVAKRVNIAASGYNGNWSCTDTDDQVYGMAAVFEYAAGGAPSTGHVIINEYYRNFLGGGF